MTWKKIFGAVVLTTVLWIIFSVTMLIFKFFLVISNIFSVEFLGPSIVLALLVLFLAARKR